MAQTVVRQTGAPRRIGAVQYRRPALPAHPGGPLSSLPLSSLLRVRLHAGSEVKKKKATGRFAGCLYRTVAGSECGRAHGSPNHGGQFPASRSRPNKSNVLGCENEGAAALHACTSPAAGRFRFPLTARPGLGVV
jgi:hypothetical protein